MARLQSWSTRTANPLLHKNPADKANRLHQRDFFGYEKAALHVAERLLEHSQEGY